LHQEVILTYAVIIPEPALGWTIPAPAERLPVQARVVDGRAARWVGGIAHAWTRDAVCVWWTDVDCLQRIDWLLASDVRRV
jgi:hypothetical protein